MQSHAKYEQEAIYGTTYIVDMENSQQTRLCGARSGSPQLLLLIPCITLVLPVKYITAAIQYASLKLMPRLVHRWSGFLYKWVSWRPKCNYGGLLYSLLERTNQCSSEAFRVFGRNLPILVTSLPVFRRSLRREAAPQTNVGKEFRISAPILKMSTIPLNITIEYGRPNYTLQCTRTLSVTPAVPTSEGNSDLKRLYVGFAASTETNNHIHVL